MDIAKLSPEAESSHLLEQAKMIAQEAHKNQKYNERPYMTHIMDVVNELEPYGETAQTVGYLHDVVEDTDITLKEIENKFGKLIAECVGILSDEPGENRKEKKEKTYKKMSEVAGDQELALTVKAADRLANIRASINDKNIRKFKLYQKEHQDFKNAVYREGLCDDLWDKIDNLM